MFDVGRSPLSLRAYSMGYWPTRAPGYWPSSTRVRYVWVVLRMFSAKLLRAGSRAIGRAVDWATAATGIMWRFVITWCVPLGVVKTCSSMLKASAAANIQLEIVWVRVPKQKRYVLLHRWVVVCVVNFFFFIHQKHGFGRIHRSWGLPFSFCSAWWVLSFLLD